MNENTKPTKMASCERVVDEMASVLDGSASVELLEHVASCDTCRDARHDAERAELLMTEAGSDFQLPDGFATRLQSRDDAVTPVPVPVRAPDPTAAPGPPAAAAAPAEPKAAARAPALQAPGPTANPKLRTAKSLANAG